MKQRARESSMIQAVEPNSDVINNLLSYAEKKLPKKKAKLVCAFIRQYYANVAPDELASRPINDLYGAILSHWELFYARKPHEYNIHIFNPQFEQYGWQSTHTVIEIVHE